MSSTIFQPGMCVNHPNVGAKRRFLCAECMEFADKEREKIEAAALAKKGIKVPEKSEKKVPTVAPGTMCINHPKVDAVEGRFCADCKAWRDQKNAQIETVRTEAAKKAAVERTGNPNATGKRGRVADPLKQAAKEEEKAERRIEKKAIREAEKNERAESKAEREARIAAFREAENRAMLCKSEQVPALVLMRAANPEAILNEVAKLGRHFLRSGKIHFMPRSQRNRKDAIRAERPDLLIGPLAADLDPAPFALWIPLDPNGGNKSDLPWFREVIETKQVALDKYILVHEIPAEVPDRCNPSSWNEIADMTGAEVIDLRNYPDVLAEVSDSIKGDLDQSTEWSDILRENADIRNGLCFAKTGERQEEYFDLVAADPENMKREDPPAEIKAIVKECAEDFPGSVSIFSAEAKSLLSGRSIVLEFPELS